MARLEVAERYYQDFLTGSHQYIKEEVMMMWCQAWCDLFCKDTRPTYF